MGTLLFRLDDITPDLNWEQFERIRKIFDEYRIAPLLGIVPDNRDAKLKIQEEKQDFWEYMKALEKEGWMLCQHGYQHTYVTAEGGILGVNKQSEFAGLSYEEQYKKLQTGRDILQNKGIHVTMFMAPGHTYDRNTLKALKKLGIQSVTDGYARVPYVQNGVTCVPCTVSKPVIPQGQSVDTVCYHVNHMTDSEFLELEDFLKKHRDVCCSYGEYIERLSNGVVSPKGWKLIVEERKNLLIRSLKRMVATHPVFQDYFQRTAGKGNKRIRRVLGLPGLVWKLIVYRLTGKGIS